MALAENARALAEGPDGCSVHVWQFAAAASGKPAFFETFLAVVVWRFQPAEIAKVVGESDKMAVEIGVALFGKSHNPRPHAPPLFEPR